MHALKMEFIELILLCFSFRVLKYIYFFLQNINFSANINLRKLKATNGLCKNSVSSFWSRKVRILLQMFSRLNGQKPNPVSFTNGERLTGWLLHPSPCCLSFN